MHRIVQFFGAIAALVGACTCAFAVAAATHGDMGAALIAVSYGASALLAGAVLWCFGSIVGLLKAIRDELIRRPQGRIDGGI